jgi:ABC-type Fe3+/spermidine/putrescine transport system ATPase subunit
MSARLSIAGLVVAPRDSPPVLRGVDLEVPGGARLALVGPSGAGKTTLLRAIVGLEQPSAGTLDLGGVAQAALPVHRRRMAMVFQEPRLLAHLSVADNVALPLRADGIDRRRRRALARERLDEVGLGGFADRSVTGLSGGEQQRVALARALSAEPLLLLLDEPLAGLDPNRREALRRLIVKTQTQRELTTIVVTHDRSEAAEVGESIALMLEGRIVQQGDPREMFERPGSGAAARFFGVSNLLRLPGEPDGAVWAIRPERVIVGSGPTSALVIEAVYRGTQVRLLMDWQGQRLEALVSPVDAPTAGERVAIELPRTGLWRLPGRSGAAPVPGGLTSTG